MSLGIEAKLTHT